MGSIFDVKSSPSTISVHGSLRVKISGGDVQRASNSGGSWFVVTL